MTASPSMTAASSASTSTRRPAAAGCSLPRARPAGKALVEQSLADGLLDAGLLTRYEGVVRPAEKQSDRTGAAGLARTRSTRRSTCWSVGRRGLRLTGSISAPSPSAAPWALARFPLRRPRLARQPPGAGRLVRALRRPALHGGDPPGRLTRRCGGAALRAAGWPCRCRSPRRCARLGARQRKDPQMSAPKQLRARRLHAPGQHTYRRLALSRRLSGRQFQLPASEALRADAGAREVRRLLHGRPSGRAEHADRRR